MARRMSFSATTQQFKNRSKWVTRRAGWQDAKPGDVITGIEKGMGLAKGETQVVLGDVVVVSVSRVPLAPISAAEVALEGFPDMAAGEFVDMFCRVNACRSTIEVTRIEFRYILPVLEALGVLERHPAMADSLNDPTEYMLEHDLDEAAPDGAEFWGRAFGPIGSSFSRASDALYRADLVFEVGPGSAREWGMCVGCRRGNLTRLFGAPRPVAQLELARGAALGGAS
jgi:hypothetical protein